jgi:alkylation response protein AidB-like acyl-CoA dehydrogenase
VLGPEALLGTDWRTDGDPNTQEVTIDEATAMRRAFIRSRAETIYAGASEIQKNIISERVLNLPKEPRR